MEGLYEQIYEVYETSLFSGPWMGESAVERAILRWSEDAFPEWFEEAGGAAINVENYIRDEEGGDELDAFIEFLEPALRLEALELIRDDLEENFEDSSEAQELIPQLNAILDNLSF